MDILNVTHCHVIGLTHGQDQSKTSLEQF